MMMYSTIKDKICKMYNNMVRLCLNHIDTHTYTHTYMLLFL